MHHRCQIYRISGISEWSPVEIRQRGECTGAIQKPRVRTRSGLHLPLLKLICISVSCSIVLPGGGRGEGGLAVLWTQFLCSCVRSSPWCPHLPRPRWPDHACRAVMTIRRLSDVRSYLHFHFDPRKHGAIWTMGLVLEGRYGLLSEVR